MGVGSELRQRMTSGKRWTLCDRKIEIKTPLWGKTITRGTSFRGGGGEYRDPPLGIGGA